MSTSSSNVYMGRTPEAVLGELTSVKDLLHGVDHSIEHLLTASDTPHEKIPTLQTPAEHGPIAPCPPLMASETHAADTNNDDNSDTSAATAGPSDLQLNLSQADIAELTELLEGDSNPAPDNENAPPNNTVDARSTSRHNPLTAALPPVAQSEPAADGDAQNMAGSAAEIDALAKNIVTQIVESVVAQYLPQLTHTLSLRLNAAVQSATDQRCDHCDSDRTA